MCFWDGHEQSVKSVKRRAKHMYYVKIVRICERGLTRTEREDMVVSQDNYVLENN